MRGNSFGEWLTAVVLIAAVGSLLFMMLFQDKQTSVDTLKVIDSLGTYIERDSKLANIEHTLAVSYRLNEFEARYYALILEDLARRDSIPWELIAAVIWVESKFSATALSKKNCKGLMQLKDATAKGIAKKLGIRYYRNIAWNDIMNIVLGTEYLACDYHSKGLMYVLKKYVGGPKKKKSGDSKRYENWYKGRVSTEFYKLQYIFKGVSTKTHEESDNEGIEN